MARIRTVKPEFWSDEKIVNLPYVARLLFIGLWNFSDDYGAIEDKPEQLKLLVLPNEERIEIYQLVDLLISAELLDRYVDYDNDKTFLIVKNWESHQKIDHPSKSRIAKEGAVKVSIPSSVRRKVAEKYGCIPGENVKCECYFCGNQGLISWSKKRNGDPSGWVSFSHELSHLVPESKGGDTDSLNLVLSCRQCNRSMGVRNAFDWLFNGKYFTSSKAPVIEQFRILSNEFAKTREDSRWKGKEGNGKDGKGISIGELNFSFENFWNLYDKKVGDKDKLIKKWTSLSDFDRQLIMDHIPKYKQYQPDKKFRKDPSTFFNNKSWLDEIIKNNGPIINSTGNNNGKLGTSEARIDAISKW